MTVGVTHLKNCFISLAGAVLLSAAALVSCQKELCYDHTHQMGWLEVRYQWDDCEGNPAPVSTNLAMFREGSSTAIEESFAGSSGGRVVLPKAKFRLIGYNSDTENLSSRGSSWENYEIYVRSADLTRLTRLFNGTRSVPRALGAEDEVTTFAPDPLWTSASDWQEVVPDNVTYVDMQMEDATSQITVVIVNMPNVEYMTDCFATISGLSMSWQPALHHCSDTRVTQPVTMRRDGKGVVGTMRYFGHCPSISHPGEHMLMLYVGLTDGQRLYYSFNVTDMMHRQSHEGEGWPSEVEIVIDEEVPLPEPITSEGMDIQVGDWQEISIDIPLL